MTGSFPAAGSGTGVGSLWSEHTLPELTEILAAAHPFSVGLRTRFRGVEHREGLLLEGPAGWGEFAPFLEYDARMASRWLSAAVESAWLGWPSPVRDSVAVNAIVPEGTAEQAADMAAAAAASGISTVKVKVGSDRVADPDRLAAVRAVLGPGGAIRADVNGGWALTEAARIAPQLDQAAGGLAYIEQPVHALADVAMLRRATGVRVAIDESLRLSADPSDPRLLRAIDTVADTVVLKSTPLGGVRPALAIAAALETPVVVSSAMDTSVGLAAGVALARALPDEPLACGLGTGELLADDLIVSTTTPVAGRLGSVPTAPDPELLQIAGSSTSQERVQWWRDRLTAAYRVLAGVQAR